MCKKLYICDGQACEGKAKYCYLNGGECLHTTNVEHSLKAKLQDKFPPTKFVEFSPEADTGILEEEIDVLNLLRELHSGKTYSFSKNLNNENA